MRNYSPIGKPIGDLETLRNVVEGLRYVGRSREDRRTTIEKLNEPSVLRVGKHVSKLMVVPGAIFTVAYAYCEDWRESLGYAIYGMIAAQMMALVGFGRIVKPWEAVFELEDIGRRERETKRLQRMYKNEPENLKIIEQDRQRYLPWFPIERLDELTS